MGLGLSKVSAKDWTKALQGGFKPKFPKGVGQGIEVKTGLTGLTSTVDLSVPSWVSVPSC